MVKNRALLFIVCLLISFTSQAQRYAEGTVVNKSTGQAIPYVNVYLKNYSYLGTISNLEGNFKLRIYDVPGDSVVFSHVGFKRKAFSTGVFSAPKKIELDELEKMLSEVIIMPDSSLRQMLRKAFKNIENNYPNTGTLSEGFYRETNQIVGDKQFIYFAESTIEFYKPSYHNNNFGPVKIIKGGKAEVDSRRTYSNVYFYAGVYTPQSKDFVKQRAEFINPSTFRLYDYAIEGVMKDGDREIMDISFKPKADSRNKAGYVGRFQLDKKTLAYISAEFDLTPVGLKNHHRGVLINVKDTKIHYDVRYRELDGRWHFSSLVYDGELYNPKYKNYLRHTSEFVTTSTKAVNENPIRESDAITYTAIYTDQQVKFTDDYWHNSETIARDSTLEKQVQLLFSKKELDIKIDTASKVVQNLPLKPSGSTRQKRFINFLIRFSADLSVGVVPIANTVGSWDINYANAISIQKSIGSDLVWFYDSDWNYKLNRSFTAYLNIANQISQTKEFGGARLGIDYRKRIAGWRLPLSFHAGIGFGTVYMRQEIGNATPGEDFSAGGKKFAGGKSVEMLVGRSGVGVFPTLQLNYNFKPRLQVYAGVTFYSPIATHDRLTLRQKKNFFSTTSASVNLKNDAIDFKINGVPQDRSPIHFLDLPAMFRVGFALGVD